MFFRTLVVLSIGTATAAASPSQAYYISPSGSDSNHGNTADSPWKTLAKLNGVKIAPGSAVYLECGAVFREPLLVSASGSPGAPVSYSSYGPCTSSNLPIISGADLLTAWNAEQEGGATVYSSADPNPPAVVFEDNHRLTASGSSSEMPAGSYFYDQGRQLVYVRTREDSAPGSHAIEASVRENAVVLKGVSYVNIAGIEADKATKNGILAWGNLTNVNLTGTVTNYSYGNGIWFTASPGQSQNNVLIKNCIADYNGENGVMKGGGGNNFVIEGCTANYNSFDQQFKYTSGIRFVSNANGLYRPTNSGAIGNTAAFNGVDPETGQLKTSGVGQEGSGVWCDTCGDGSFLKANIAHDNAQNGVMLEFSGAEGRRTMAYNIAYRNRSAGIFHSRRSHSDTVANNTSYDNLINCKFTGEYKGGETAIGMFNNVYENNICASRVLNAKGTVLEVQWGTENNGLGEGSGNIFRNNSLGVPSATNGKFAIFGSGRVLTSYAELNAAYGSDMHSVEKDPMLTDPEAANFALRPGSPAIKAGWGGVDLGAIPFGERQRAAP